MLRPKTNGKKTQCRRSKREMKLRAFRNFSTKQVKFPIIQRTGTRSSSILPEFLLPKPGSDNSERYCTLVVITAAFAISMLWSLSAMAALPPTLPEAHKKPYSISQPKATTIMLGHGLYNIVVNCFPGEAIISWSAYEKIYYNSKMKKFSSLKIAMYEICKNDAVISLELQ